jgi:polyisoprenoid-binding protein YceI
MKVGLPHNLTYMPMKTLFLSRLQLFFLLGLFFQSYASKSQNTIVYKVDTNLSHLTWTGYYMFNFGEHTGSIKLSSGSIQAHDQSITSGYFEIDMNSIKDIDMPENDGGKDLVAHLMSEDFFAVDKFPVARFEIAKTEIIKEAKQGSPNFNVTGDLLIKGVKNSITFPAVITFQKNGLVASAKFKFDRTKWDIHYNSGKFFSDVGDGAISDAIAIEINLVALK